MYSQWDTLQQERFNDANELLRQRKLIEAYRVFIARLTTERTHRLYDLSDYIDNETRRLEADPIKYLEEVNERINTK